MPTQTNDQWGSLLPPGLGNDQQASQATAAMRQSPWYQQQMQQWGNTATDANGNPTNKLTDSQQQDLYNLALKNGIGLNNKYDQVDENGQISEAHHKLRDALIGAGIGAAALSGFGAAGIGPLSGLFGVSGGITAGTGADVAGASALGGGGVLGGLPGAMTALPGLGAGAGSTMSSMIGPMSGGETGTAATDLASLPPDSISTLLQGSNPLASLGVNGNIGSLVAGGTGSNVSGSAGGLMSKLMSEAGQKGFGNLSSSLGSLTQGIANNRVTQGDFSQKYDQNAIAAQTAANAARSAALKQLAQSNYLLNKQPSSGPTSIQLGGQMRQLPTFGSAPLPISDAQRTGATNLQTTANQTLAPGGTYTPQPLSSYATPGTGENAANIGATMAGLLPTAMNIWKMF